MEEQLEEFTVHRAVSSKPPPCPPHDHILRNCQHLENQLVHEHLKKVVRQLLTICNQQCMGVPGLIFPLHLHKNQEEELSPFLALLEEELDQHKEEVFKPRKESGRSGQEHRVGVVFLDGSEVRDLVLQMYIYLEEHREAQMVVFVARQVTDLSEHNLYCFEKALKEKRFAAVMSTFATFEGESESMSHVQYEKYHISLYNPKELFCEFVYQCMARKAIKAYLPEGVLTLISDMDYYSLSFRQSCRRFCYCLQRALMLWPEERSWVDFESIINAIQDNIARTFRFYFGYHLSLEKILKVILSHHEGYTISQKAVSLEVAMGTHMESSVDENNLMNSIRDSLLKSLSKKPQFSPYLELLTQSEEQPQPVVRKKRTRADQLGIDMKKNITPKNRLEAQITRIIKQVTQPIRTQASRINWQDISYDLRIRPQIPTLLLRSYQEDPLYLALLEEILSEYAAPVSKHLEGGSEQGGRLAYLLKVLQLSGIIDLTKKQHRPTICLNYFQKASFSGSHR